MVAPTSLACFDPAGDKSETSSTTSAADTDDSKGSNVPTHSSSGGTTGTGTGGTTSTSASTATTETQDPASTEETTTTSEQTSTPDDTSSEEEVDDGWTYICGDTSVCLPALPQYWLGYIALWQQPVTPDGTPTRPDCPEEFARNRYELDVFIDSKIVNVGVACLGKPISALGCAEGTNFCLPYPSPPFEHQVCAMWSSGVSECPADSSFSKAAYFSVDGDSEHQITLCCMAG